MSEEGVLDMAALMEAMREMFREEFQGVTQRMERLAITNHRERRKRTTTVESSYTHGGRIERSSLGDIRMVMPTFLGRDDPEAYLGWEKKMKSTFNSHDYSENTKVKMATYTFTDHAAIWWDKIQSEKPSTETSPLRSSSEVDPSRNQQIPSHNTVLPIQPGDLEEVENKKKIEKEIEENEKRKEEKDIEKKEHSGKKIERKEESVERKENGEKKEESEQERKEERDESLLVARKSEVSQGLCLTNNTYYLPRFAFSYFQVKEPFDPSEMPTGFSDIRMPEYPIEGIHGATWQDYLNCAEDDQLYVLDFRDKGCDPFPMIIPKEGDVIDSRTNPFKERGNDTNMIIQQIIQAQCAENLNSLERLGHNLGYTYPN